MKKKTIKTLLILVSSLCLYGCGEDAPSVSENTSANAVSQNLVAEKDFYSGDLTSEYGEHLRYELTLLDLSNCYFDQYYINNDGSYIQYHAEGAYVITDSGFYLRFSIAEEQYYGEVYIENGEIIGAYSDYYMVGEFADIEGMYDCESELGTLLLSIDEYGNAKLSVDDMVYTTAGVIIYEDQYDLMVMSDEYEMIYDWIITFNDDGTFSYIDYSEYVFAAFEGEYECKGQLGDFTLVIDERGECTAVFELDGKEQSFTGTPTVYDGDIISIFLVSQDDYYVTLDFENNDMDNKILYYSGTYTVPVN